MKRFCLLSLSIVMLFAACGSPQEGDADGGTIIVVGSDSMVNIMAAWAEDFGEANPDTEVEVSGGGSGNGINALIQGTTDIATASRRMKDTEFRKARNNDIDAQEVIVGLDGIAIAVNTGNPINHLTLAELKAIYTGEVTHWNQLERPGLTLPEEEIVAVSRDSSSGTYGFFQELVLENEDYHPTVQLLQSNQAIGSLLQSSPTAVGYLALAYAERNPVKLIPVAKDAESGPVLPSIETVQSGAYPISRPLQIYHAADAPESIRKFVGYMLSERGQKILQEQDGVPLQ